VRGLGRGSGVRRDDERLVEDRKDGVWLVDELAEEDDVSCPFFSAAAADDADGDGNGIVFFAASAF